MTTILRKLAYGALVDSVDEYAVLEVADENPVRGGVAGTDSSESSAEPVVVIVFHFCNRWQLHFGSKIIPKLAPVLFQGRGHSLNSTNSLVCNCRGREDEGEKISLPEMGSDGMMGTVLEFYLKVQIHVILLYSRREGFFIIEPEVRPISEFLAFCRSLCCQVKQIFLLKKGGPDKYEVQQADKYAIQQRSTCGPLDLLENAVFGMEILTPPFPRLFVPIGAAAAARRSAAALIQVTTKGEAQGMVSKFIGIGSV
ncbi:hypothetical protein RHSIM_Rhsim08G0123200 [Rhododendron simsii]|uniref:Uncharacterized protein n=1 Tax=Rhododendron simsii TaxID=118357 RepID=A0A834LII6_RHOSS|nr:hypothetical protein RHSIM_Rhsim08G0123200 [Rhododendron simsii]